MQKVFQRYPPLFCVTKGCRVNLKDHKQGMLLSNGWKMATAQKGLAQQMDLPCQCAGKHAVCQGALTRRSAYYTSEFARRVCVVRFFTPKSRGIFMESCLDSMDPPSAWKNMSWSVVAMTSTIHEVT